MKAIKKILLAGLLTGLGGCEIVEEIFPPDPPDATNKDANRVRINAGCVNGVKGFTIDVPLWADAPAAGFTERFLDALELQPDYFCVEGESRCIAPPQVEASLVETIRSVPNEVAWDDDVENRFFRLQFSNGDFLRVREGSQCAVMEAIRSALVEADDTEFFVSRTWCAVSGMGIPAGISSEDPMATWHLDHLGLSAPVVNQEPNVTLTIIDSLADLHFGPTDEVIHAPPEIRDPSGNFEYELLIHLGAGIHGGTSDHGRGMALLANEAAGPAAYVVGRESLDHHGVASVSVVANAVYRSLVAPPEDGPTAQIMNLSLGWPPELERRRVVPLSCGNIIEDPIGEPMRYMLAGAAEMDQPGAAHLLVAAAGNRPHRPDTATLFGTETPAQRMGPCAVDAPAKRGFYPAEYWREPICRADGVPLPVPLLPVGAHNSAGELSGTRVQGAEVPFIVPGDHVYATLPPVPGQADAFSCNDAVADTGALRQFPQVFTGSSVSSALAAGLATRVFSEVDKSIPLSGRMLASLLYLMGDDTPYVRGMTPVRRGTWTHLSSYLASCPDCDLVPLEACLLFADTAPDYFAAAQLCDPLRVGFEALEPAEVTWSDGIEACMDNTAVPLLVDPPIPEWLDCALDPHACLTSPARMERGALGPLPTVPICPDCQIDFLIDDDQIRMYLWLNAKFVGAEFSKPTLYLNTPIGTFSTNLEAYTDVDSWSPNAVIKIPAFPVPDGFDTELLGDSSVVLDVNVFQDDKEIGGVEPSVLRVFKTF